MDDEKELPQPRDAEVGGETTAMREPYEWKDGIERVPRPMDRYLPAVLEQLRDNQVIVVQAETGTGKTSRIPQAILDSDPEAHIIMTQLTRPAVAWNGAYMAREMESHPGGVVGWRLRREEPVVSDETRCQLVIDQSLLNKVIRDGRLPDGVLVTCAIYRDGYPPVSHQGISSKFSQYQSRDHLSHDRYKEISGLF